MNTQYRATVLAQVLGISKQRIASLLHEGRLVSIKMGRNVFIDLADPVNLAFLEARKDLPAELARKVSQLRADPSCILDEQSDDDEGDSVEELLRLAFTCDAGNLECALDTDSHLRLPAKIAKAARTAKDLPTATKAVERTLGAYLKTQADGIIAEGERFIEAWREDDLDYYMNGPSDEDLDAAQGEGGAKVTAKKPRTGKKDKGCRQ